MALTPRQKEIALLRIEGLRTDAIAERLGIGHRTVTTYQSDIRDALGLTDYRAPGEHQLMALLTRGLITANEACAAYERGKHGAN